MMLDTPLTDGNETVQPSTVHLTKERELWIGRQLSTLRPRGWIEEERPWATTDGRAAYLELLSTNTSITSLTTQKRLHDDKSSCLPLCLYRPDCHPCSIEILEPLFTASNFELITGVPVPYRVFTRLSKFFVGPKRWEKWNDQRRESYHSRTWTFAMMPWSHYRVIEKWFEARNIMLAHEVHNPDAVEHPWLDDKDGSPYPQLLQKCKRLPGEGDVPQHSKEQKELILQELEKMRLERDMERDIEETVKVTVKLLIRD
jgi:hypothetical protein